MPRYAGVAIDIGGPLRVSDIEMNRGHRAAFEKRSLRYPLEDMEAWQLYGITAPGYAPFMRAALALSRAGKRLRDFVAHDDPRAALFSLADSYTTPEEAGMIKEMAAESEAAYNANPSTRLNNGARLGVFILLDNGIPQTIVTESLSEPTRAWLRHPDVNLARYFTDDAVFGKDNVGQGVANPKVALLLASAERMGIPIQDMLYVGDTLGDISGSREAGCTVGMVLNGMGMPEIWRRVNMPDFEFADFGEAARYVERMYR